MNVFVAATANNAHLREIGIALEEAGMLSRFQVPFGGYPLAKPVFVKSRFPTGIPASKVGHSPSWEIARLAAAKLRLPSTVVDLIWERGEWAFDRTCADLVAKQKPDAYLGIEHAALSSLKTAKRVGTRAGLIFPSLHHRFRKKWLDPELEKFPELMSSNDRSIRKRDAARDERRDQEMGEAEFIHANSQVTARSLTDAGYPAHRIITVPLGAPAAISDEELQRRPVYPPSVIFAGNIALHKGAHHLLEAWRRIKGAHGAVLDLYGAWALPTSLLPKDGDAVVLHGRVASEVVREAMRRASVLVLPSVCDGFGMVVTEAMAQGIPVICSSNAGASQIVSEAKNGFVVPPANPEFLATKITWCLEHPDELRAMGRNAAATARVWSWSQFRATFIRELSSTLQRINQGSAAPMPPR